MRSDGNGSGYGGFNGTEEEDDGDDTRAPFDRDDFKVFFEGYVSALLWTEGRDAGGPLDLPEQLRNESLRDCFNFFRDHWRKLHGAYDQGGHDFWLSRNGHGSGFFDGNYQGDQKFLQDRAREYSSVDVVLE